MRQLAVTDQRRLFAWLGPFALGAAALMWPLLGLLFLIRRLSGELQQLPGGALVLTGVVLATIAFALHRAWPNAWGKWLPASALAMYAVALSISGTHPAALVVFWLALIGEEVASGWLARSRATPPRVAVPTVAESSAVDVAEPEEESEEAALLPPNISQQITRTRSGAREETLLCLLRVCFASGEQTQTLHVAFCPALEGELQATSAHLEGAPCEIKLTQVETFGARLDVKRRGALQLADEAIIQLQVIATVGQASSLP